jgi:uridine nucleosidase
MYITPLQAIQKDPNFAKNIGQLVVLGGAFNASGNVNPAAEANVSLKRQKSHSRNVRGSSPTSHH